MITVLQVALGKVPYYLVPCMMSVSKWAECHGHKYIVLTDIDNPYRSAGSGFDWVRHCSDYMRMDYLSRYPRTLYVDWDMFVQDIVIDDLSISCFTKHEIAAGLIYNGDDLALFEKLKEGITPKIGEYFPLMGRLRHYISSEPHQKFRGTFTHMDNCIIVRQSYDTH